MAYTNFTFERLESEFNLTINKGQLFNSVKLVEISEWLRIALERGRKLPLLTEKARSEQIVTPILEELVALNNFTFNIYSGQELNVLPEKDLNGETDYLLSKNPNAYLLSAPIFGLVEAKKKDIDSGLPQCIAQLMGARIFNEQEKNELPILYGCVTTGDIWQFIKLEKNMVTIDANIYSIANLSELLGVLQQIIDKYT
jgi:hypothetical protein